MLVHIGICSVIGGLSVSCTQGLGASILTSIRGNNQVRPCLFKVRLSAGLIRALVSARSPSGFSGSSLFLSVSPIDSRFVKTVSTDATPLDTVVTLLIEIKCAFVSYTARR
jgi:hypothetical protein